MTMAAKVPNTAVACPSFSIEQEFGCQLWQLEPSGIYDTGGYYES